MSPNNLDGMCRWFNLAQAEAGLRAQLAGVNLNYTCRVATVGLRARLAGVNLNYTCRVATVVSIVSCRCTSYCGLERLEGKII